MRLLIVFLFLGGQAAFLLHGYPNGSRVPNGNAGEPGTGTPCAACHGVTLNPAGGKVELAGGSATFQAGQRQRLTLTVTDANTAWRKGFQLTASGGTFTAVTSTVVNTASNGRQYVNQSAAASSFVFDWTAPAGVDAVTIWMAGAACNGTRQTNVYTQSLTLRAAGARPSIRTADGVVNAATYASGISPGSWVTIYGGNLAPAGVARSWRAEEIVDGRLPLSLEGTRVRINGKDAAISYVSETQLNVQAPDDGARGVVAVEVITAGGASDAASADLRAAAPGFFRFAPNENRYAAAVNPDGVLAGPPGLLGAGVALRPAQPGQTLILYGTGFGPAEPAVEALRAFAGAAPLADPGGLSVRIGGVNAVVQWAGLVSAGLYQFNVVVPELPDGDHLLEAQISGQTVPVAQYVAVRR